MFCVFGLYIGITLYNGPVSVLVYRVMQPIAHYMHFLVCFRICMGAFFIDPDAIVFPGEVNDQCIHGGCNFMQPLLIAFFDKCLTHALYTTKIVPVDELRVRSRKSGVGSQELVNE